MSPNKITEAIKRYSKFLITSHIDLEGDALGSELALASLLRKLGKYALIVNSDRTPSNYRFLPGVETIRHQLNNLNFQAAFIIDCPDIQRIGKVVKLIDKRKFIVNIDHHLGNKGFGAVNWIDPQASSVGEMIYHLFKLTKTKIDKKVALNIYTAILTDTGSFRHSNTTSKALNICSQLLKLGINPAEIYSRIYEGNLAQDVISIAKLISQMCFAANNQIAWVKINKNIFAKIKTKHELLDKILDFAKSIKKAKVIIVFCQINNDVIKINLRSKTPVNVQRIARLFGGGGHKLASGCVVKASLKEAQKLVLKEVKKALKIS